MNTRKVTEQYRLGEWAQAVQARRESGQTVKEFCEAAGTTTRQYYYWQHKLRKVAYTALIKKKSHDGKEIIPSEPTGGSNARLSTPPGWASLTEVVSEPAADSSLTVEIGDCRIKVSAETDSALLAKVCGVLRSL